MCNRVVNTNPENNYFGIQKECDPDEGLYEFETNVNIKLPKYTINSLIDMSSDRKKLYSTMHVNRQYTIVDLKKIDKGESPFVVIMATRNLGHLHYIERRLPKQISSIYPREDRIAHQKYIADLYQFFAHNSQPKVD